MTFSSGEKKFQYVKNVIILWYFGYKPLSNDKYIQKSLSKSSLLDIFIVWQWLVAEISQNNNVFDILELFFRPRKR